MPLSNRVGTARIRRGIPMTDLEYNRLLNISLAKYGLTVKLVTESSYMPATGVIMTPKSTKKES